MNVTFYEKPGCAGNAKQKKLLDLYNISYETKNILSTPWKENELHAFFAGLDKENIVNIFAPKIKNGEVEVAALSKEELVKLMIQEPILIKRPLLAIGEHKLCGFDIAQINKVLQKNICESVSISTCQSKTSCETV